MKRFHVMVLVWPLILVGAAACGEDEETFTAMLSGSNEVPAVTTDASGTATFTLTEERTISYTITVSNIQNVTASHIHDAPAGVNGDVIVGLFDGPVTGSVNGTLISGTFDQSGVSQGSFEDLLAKMRAGTVYVNVHTSENLGGEIRGQIQLAN